MTDRPGEMDERDVEERFASIVAAWDSPLPDDEGGSTTHAEPADGPPADGSPTDGSPADGSRADGSPAEGSRADGSAPSDDGATAGPGAPPPARPPWVNPSPLDLVVPASTWRTPTTPTGPGAVDGQGPGSGDTSGDRPAAAPDDDEHFEPPPVTLPPQEDLHFWGAVIGLVGGPLLLLYVALARPFHSERWFAAGVLLSLLGFGLLVLRQPRHRDPDDTDDGARV